MKKLFLFIVSVILFGTTTLLAQELTLKTYGVSPRDVERDTVEQYFDRRYNSLQNVGVETKVFLKGQFEDSVLTAPTWTFLERPSGSTAAFGTTKDLDGSTQLTTFIPDTIGRYIIEFSDGSAADTIRINAGLFLGVTNGNPNCKVCHNTAQWDFKYDKWMETGHAHALEKGLDGEKGSYFNNNCVQCHSTGYDPLASNDGFDDWPFVFPDTLMPGMYDSLLIVYPDAMARANIQCEQCHGPGSEHFGNRFNIAKVINPENCNYCHNAGTHHVYGEQWINSVHGIGSRSRTSKTCAPCHNGLGFIQYIKGGKVPLTSNIDDTYPIGCATCHDPHDAGNSHQLRTLEATLENGYEVPAGGYGKLCMNCHKSRRNAEEYVQEWHSHYGPHYGVQGDMINASNAITWGLTLSTSPHLLAELPGHGANSCVNCHMAGEDKVDENGNPILVGGHTWEMGRDGVDNVAACEPCHGDIGDDFSDKKLYINGWADLDGNGVTEGLQHEVEGLLDILGNLLPPIGDPEVNVDTNYTLLEREAAYNYIYVEDDRSLGIHNPRFTYDLLVASIEALGGTVNVPDAEGNLPVEYSLAQNYPNPFNPSTTIEYSLPEQANVTIKIYDVLGKELEVLFSGNKSAGTHRLNWDASNYASGIYFYKMNAGTFNQVKKMLLLK